jgi:hypothetical protein
MDLAQALCHEHGESPCRDWRIPPAFPDKQTFSSKFFASNVVHVL